MKSKVIITATTANSWIYPKVKNWAVTRKELVKDVKRCADAGAAIAHIHLPKGEEIITVEEIRNQCDIIIQAGMSSYPIEEREQMFKARPDMLSIILNHHDERFVEISVNQLHPLEELEEYCVRCHETEIKPEWEVWHTGSYWNLNQLVKKGLIKPPHVVTLFFGWPGGTWSPPTIDEYLHRLKYMPENCVHSISVMGPQQKEIAVAAMLNGGNVRVGTEDYPFLGHEKPAKNNGEIVERFCNLARELGCDIVDVSEAREMLGLKQI